MSKWHMLIIGILFTIIRYMIVTKFIVEISIGQWLAIEFTIMLLQIIYDFIKKVYENSHS